MDGILKDPSPAQHRIYPRMDAFLKQRVGRVKGLALDLGCGTAESTKVLFDLASLTIGMNFSSEMLKIAKKKFPTYDFVRASVTHLPFKGETFDLVYERGTLLGHMPSKDGELAIF